MPDDSRPKKKRESKGAYWMDTYGDMVTLLMTFFVMMFAASQMSESKWIRIVESFTGQTPGSVVEPIDPLNPTSGFQPSDYVDKPQPRDNPDISSGSTEQSEQNDMAEQQFNQLYDRLVSYINENGLANSVSVERDGQYVYVTVLEGVLFDTASADIRPDSEAAQVLVDLGQIFMNSWDAVRTLRIEGHTDSDPIQNGSFADNRSLSAERANSVFRYLHDTVDLPNVPNVETVGMGETVPVASNDTPEGKARNRRVEFILESSAALTE
ncbi:MAG: flagellar motor protein MotB [Clostridia bacterium]|nr:flagellar motor protein MotB [Clostridia bacterium]